MNVKIPFLILLGLLALGLLWSMSFDYRRIKDIENRNSKLPDRKVRLLDIDTYKNNHKHLLGKLDTFSNGGDNLATVIVKTDVNKMIIPLASNIDSAALTNTPVSIALYNNNHYICIESSPKVTQPYCYAVMGETKAKD